MMEPQLVSWHEKWSKQGLVIIEIDNGQIDSLDEVETHVADRNIPFTVLHDKGGTVIWEGHPTDPSVNAVELIQAALA